MAGVVIYSNSSLLVVKATLPFLSTVNSHKVADMSDDPQVSQPTSVSIAGVPVLTPEGQRKAEDMAIEYLGQSVLRDNITNYHMANKLYMDSIYTASKMGSDVFNQVKDRIAPFPQTTNVLNQNFTPPPAPQPTAPVAVTPVSTGNPSTLNTSGWTDFAKKAATYGAIAASSGGIAVGAPAAYSYLTTPKEAVVVPAEKTETPPVQTPTRDPSLDLEIR